MYQPDKYKKSDPDYIFRFIREHPFATIVLQGDHLMATHIPVLTEGNAQSFRLFSHIANHNKMLPHLKDGAEALLIFQGSHAYVSSSWYAEKDISTWDYSAVHINAKITLQSEKELENSLRELVARFEKSQENPLFYDDIPREMIKENFYRITGFWCAPTKIEAIAKLHQGFVKVDIHSIIQHLDNQNKPLSSALSRDIQKEHGTEN